MESERHGTIKYVYMYMHVHVGLCDRNGNT